jgi:hypothetical protein
VQALHTALQAHVSDGRSGGLHILSSESAAVDGPMLESLAAAPHTVVLLMGLDLPCPSADRPAQEAEDARLRAALAGAGLGFRVVYGQGAQRAAHAFFAINSRAASAYPASAGGNFPNESEEHADRPLRLRNWSCEKCSDPECEHRLFTALPGRQTRAT